MHKYILMLAWVTLSLFKSVSCQAQEVGLSFSYFIPENGNFAVPVSPFSYRGIGINFGDYFSIETGISLYLMPGLGVTDLPLETDKPLIGPMGSILVPLELVFQFYLPNQIFRIKAGGFGFYNLFPGVRQGNFDRAIAEWQNFELVNSQVEFDNLPGVGLIGGIKYILYLQQNFGITLGANYLYGRSNLNLHGTYLGGNQGGAVTANTFDFEEAMLNFSGFEFSVGVLVGGG